MTPRAQAVHAERELALLQLELEGQDIDSVILMGLHEFLDDFQRRIARVNDAISEHIFHAWPDPA